MGLDAANLLYMYSITMLVLIMDSRASLYHHGSVMQSVSDHVRWFISSKSILCEHRMHVRTEVDSPGLRYHAIPQGHCELLISREILDAIK